MDAIRREMVRQVYYKVSDGGLSQVVQPYCIQGIHGDPGLGRKGQEYRKTYKAEYERKVSNNHKLLQCCGEPYCVAIADSEYSVAGS